MPLVRIEITKGKSSDFKKKLLDIVHNALVNNIKIPDDDRRQRLYELEPENFEKNGRGDDYMIIEITMFIGRSFEAKKKLYREIVDNISSLLNVPPNDITIVIHEPELQNWGIRGGIPASEANVIINV